MYTCLKPYVICSVFLLLLSCEKNKQAEIYTISVDSNKNTPLSLSAIADHVEAIELETTEQSLIKKIMRIFCTSNYIVTAERGSIKLFDKTGKFIRPIGSTGQGPGEYNAIQDVAVDLKKNKIFVFTYNQKIICYDLEGNLIKESESGYYNGAINYVNCIDNKLLLLSESFVQQNGDRTNRTVLYFIDDDLLKTDSVEVRNTKSNGIWINPFNDNITVDDGNIYLYYADITTNPIVFDTLYHLNGKQLLPYVDLKFKDNGLIGGDKNIYIFSMYKSSRYLFSYYKSDSRRQFYYFCHDIKSKENFNMENGFTDDIYTGEAVQIRPLKSDANMFYYLHTNMAETDKEEPNPTLYIGMLKK